MRNRVGAHLEGVRSKGKPSLVEAFTYRYRGHSAADPEVYREKSEVEEWRQKDPIESFIRLCLDQGALSEEDVEGARREADETVEAAVRFAD